MTEQDCIFCKIARGDIQSQILYQDDQVFVIRDIHPKAPVHLLIIPLGHITDLASEDPDRTATLGQMFVVGREMAQQEGVTQGGYRLTLNQGSDAGQVIAHVHLHLLGGRRLAAMG